jgi:DNA-binding MarR family transcriptional regulator
MTKSLQQLISRKLNGLTGSQVKAFLIIWSKTYAVGKKSRKITNNQFIEIGGKSLANKPAVVNATNALAEMKLIFKVRDETDSLNYFSINENI